MSTKRELCIGQPFGKWIILDPTDIYRRSTRYVLCQCACGNVREVCVGHLISGRSNACHSCAGKTAAATRDNSAYTHFRPPSPLRHRHTTSGEKTLTYTSWQGMRARCENPQNINWYRYGAKGITVCERWRSFDNFLADMGERPGKGYSIDRIDNTLGYFSENCRWATWKEQQRNTSRNRLITFQDETHPLATWAERMGLAWVCLR